MSTPFSPFANATIAFKVPLSEPTIGEFGHKEYKYKKIVVTAFLKQARLPQPVIFEEGNQELVYVEGRCIDPKTIPVTIKPETIMDAVVDGVEYKFRYQGKVQSPFYPENDLLGQPLKGFLIQTDEWGNLNG
jgi:hypothetical protein